jgi:cysteine sulfinate desulfinase/cysteine desulfurase-like protein
MLKYFDSNANYPMNAEAIAEYGRFTSRNIAALDGLSSTAGKAATEQAASTQRVISRLERTLRDVYNVPEYLAVYTSGASECNSMIIHHFMYDAIMNGTKAVFACPIINHPSTTVKLAQMEKDGICNVHWIQSDDLGNVSIEAYLRASMGADCLFIQSVNSETGCMQPVNQVASAINASNQGCKVAVDDVQGFLKASINGSLCDYICISAHKIGGPIGIGTILMKSKMHSMIGGKQNHGMRGGTYNIAGMASMMSAIDRFDNSIGERNGMYFLEQLAKEMEIIDYKDFIEASSRPGYGIPSKLFIRIGTKNTLPHVIFGVQMRGNTVVCGGITKAKLLARDILIGTGSACNVVRAAGIQYGSMRSTRIQQELQSGFIRISMCGNSRTDINELVGALSAM